MIARIVRSVFVVEVIIVGRVPMYSGTGVFLPILVGDDKLV